MTLYLFLTCFSSFYDENLKRIINRMRMRIGYTSRQLTNVTLSCLLRGAASWARPPAGENPSHFRRVQAATLAPKGVTILGTCWRQHMARFPGEVLAQNVGTPNRITMSNETARRAAIGAPLWFVPVHTTRAGLTIPQIEPNKHTCAHTDLSDWSSHRASVQS